MLEFVTGSETQVGGGGKKKVHVHVFVQLIPILTPPTPTNYQLLVPLYLEAVLVPLSFVL